MPYVEPELLLEYDDEAWTSDELAERGPRFLRSRPAGIRPPPVSQAKPVGALAGGTVNTPGGGRAQLRFDKPLATKESVDELAKELKRDIAAQGEVIKKLDQTVEKNTAILDKKVESVDAALKKGLASAQQASLFPLLLSKPPQIDSIKWGPNATSANFNANGIAPVGDAGTTYKKDDNLGLLLLVMMGGLGGGGSSGDSNNMLLMALALSGGFGK